MKRVLRVNNTIDGPIYEQDQKYSFCEACGLKFQPKANETLCPICTDNYTMEPDFEDVLFSLAYGHFMLNLGFKNPEIALRKAFKKATQFKYWANKKDEYRQYQDLLENNFDSLLNKFLGLLSYIKLGNRIADLKNELNIEADKFDIFISHSWDGAESELVLPLVEALKGLDYTIWFDKDLGLDPGDVKDYLKAAINDSKYCIPIFCKSYFEKENTLFELENILALKKKKNIFPIWFSDIDTDFLKSQGDLGKEALKCSAITWKNAGEDLNAVIKKLEEFIEASQEIEEYSGVKLYERDVNVLKYFERIIGEAIPEIPSESGRVKFGFMHENQHLTGIFLKETSGNKKVQPLHLPKDIFKLKGIKYLHAPLIDLPPQISQLENLIELDVSYSVFSELPDLTPLKNLKKFVVIGCGITKCDQNTFDFYDKFFNWTQFKDLNRYNAFFFSLMLNEMYIIRDNNSSGNNNEDSQLSKKAEAENKEINVAADFIRYSWQVYSKDDNNDITAIGIDGRGIGFLPETIGVFSKLKRLELPRNQLSALPENLGKLGALTKITFTANKISSLPESIGDLTNLIYITVYDNRLVTIPKSIGNLKNLRYLYLGKNQLSYLPELITKMNSLKVLDISNNDLSSLPESIGNLKDLQKLWAKNNRLSSLPESIGNLKDLQKLYLENNQLSFLPESIGDLINLQILKISENQLTSLPESIGNLIFLQRLDLNGNKLTTLPKSIGNLIYLRTLLIDPLPSLPQEIEKALEKLKGNGCKIWRD
ncbi:MAG: leucine-rich repeat domain-containing protein [Promethearchaeota archaeon]